MNTITETLGNIDIYLLDQIMKGRYVPNQTILNYLMKMMP